MSVSDDETKRCVSVHARALKERLTQETSDYASLAMLSDKAEHDAMVNRHQKIADAIVKQDREQAVIAMAEHFNATILKIIDNGLT